MPVRRIKTAADTYSVVLYGTEVVSQLEENFALRQRAYVLGDVDMHQVSQTRGRLLMAMGLHTDATLEGLVSTELWPGQEVSP